MQGKKRLKLSKISAMHYFKLVFRSLLFLGALAIYILDRVQNGTLDFTFLERFPWVLIPIWIFMVAGMILRFFPSKTESPGCQKQFARNYRPTGRGKEEAVFTSNRRTLAVAAAWIGLNGIIGALYFLRVIDVGILLLISLLFSVCDMICILFFCPFQTWFMKNKCCTACRIYNWDYAMMFTPLVFIPHWYTYSLAICALALLIRWEVTVYRHPEWFSEVTNASLSCAHCTEKLCSHKKQLQRFLKKNRDHLQLKGNAIVNNAKGVVRKVKSKK